MAEASWKTNIKGIQAGIAWKNDLPSQLAIGLAFEIATDPVPPAHRGLHMSAVMTHGGVKSAVLSNLITTWRSQGRCTVQTSGQCETW
jgi:hypothetical protein